MNADYATSQVTRWGLLCSFIVVLTAGAASLISSSSPSGMVRIDAKSVLIDAEDYGYDDLSPGDYYGPEYGASASGFVDSFTVACGTTATEISANGQTSYACQNQSATHVYVGDAAVSGDAGVRYCDGCASTQFGGDVYKEYCRIAGLADSGVTVSVQCRARVGAEP